MKHLFVLVAAVAATLALAGAALAAGHAQTGFFPRLEPRLRAWLEPLRHFPRDPKPLHHRAAARRSQLRRSAAAPPVHPRQGTTLSVYEASAKPWVLSRQGCSAARRHDEGVVVLDFGKPAYKRHGYGTILFSGRFALNHQISVGMLGWARGYVSCLRRGSRAFVTLARGTSNYHPAVPSAVGAGRRWARATNAFQRMLQRHGLAGHVASAGADDAEPAWDRHFRKTREFIHGFRSVSQGDTLYDYGSLDGGVGSIWSAREAFYVAGGIGHTSALPEIYNSAMAREWAQLARIARSRYHSSVRFAGVMTQGTPHCRCSLRPHAAHRALARALSSVGVAATQLPRGGTDITG